MKHLHLFETYKSQKEIDELSSSIIKHIAKVTFDWHNDNIWSEPKDGDYESMVGKSYRVNFKNNVNNFTNNANYVIDTFDGNKISFKGYEMVFDINELELTWSEVNQFKFKEIRSVKLQKSVKQEDFDELRDFIKETDIIIIPEPLENTNHKNGTLGYTPGSKFMDISLYFNKTLYRTLRESKKSKITYDYNSLYIDIYYEFYNSLLHELQHAYDGYRSDGKSFQRQTQGNYGGKQIRKEEILKDRERELNEEEIEFLNTMSKEYLNFPHEINARFTQTIHRISFSNIIFSDDLKSYYSEINNWEDVYRAFKYEFQGWRHLSEKDKRRLTRKLSQFYHLDMDRIKDKNKGTILSFNEINSNVLISNSIKKKSIDCNKILKEELNEPIILYHGTNNIDFDDFNLDKSGMIKYSDWGKGIYFTRSKGVADMYRIDAVKYLDKEYNDAYDDYIRIKKDLKKIKPGTKEKDELHNLSDKAVKKFQEIGRKLNSTKKGRIIVAEIKTEAKIYRYNSGGGMTDPYLAERVKSKGYDIILVDEGKFTEEYVVLNIESIKIKKQIQLLEKESFTKYNNAMLLNENAMLIAYHVTNKKNLSSILKHGLKPSIPQDFGENGDMEGVYLFKTIEDAKNALMNWFGERIEEWEEENDEIYEEILLHVDITGIKCLDTVEFEWTCVEHISPNRIISIDYEP